MFLLSRRWLLFALTVAALAWGANLLGQWQFHRLDERRAENRLVATNLDRPPVPLDDLLAVGRPAPKHDEWREVVVHGTWDDARTIVVKYQTRDGAPGVDVVTPLRTESGAAVLVDRGWLSTENSGGTRPKLPAASTDPVTVLGWVRVDGTGGSTTVTDMAARAISSRAAAEVVPYPLYGGFVDLHTESPSPAKPLQPIELPDDTSEGPHFFYGLQWWFFGALAVIGFGYLAYDEWRRIREERRSPGVPRNDSESTQHAAVDGQHDSGHE
ncbi:SURF1 family cytochrome oxidase biogenesis protein [Marmoricola sp. URHA0025 HA25]